MLGRLWTGLFSAPTGHMLGLSHGACSPGHQVPSLESLPSLRSKGTTGAFKEEWDYHISKATVIYVYNSEGERRGILDLETVHYSVSRV